MAVGQWEDVWEEPAVTFWVSLKFFIINPDGDLFSSGMSIN